MKEDQIISQGAEAVVYEGKWFDTECIVKERPSKGYRVKKLDDNLRQKRTKQEAKLLTEARRSGVNTPKVFEVEEAQIKVEKLDGEKVRDIISEVDQDKLIQLSKKIGSNIAKLHNSNIIHGDLTTSNILLVSNELYFIDFGLGFYSSSIEDKAVDLHLLFKILESTHPNYVDMMWSRVTEGYSETSNEEDKIFNKIKEIKKRGRYVVR